MIVAVLGHRGMLGRVVTRRFTELGAEVATTALRYDGTGALVDWAAEHPVVVNCIVAKAGPYAEMLAVNARLPHDLAGRTRLIQPGTDAAWSDGPYAETKILGEAGTVIRCSLVDIEHQPAIAYTDWTWNGITPLAWADIAWRVATSEPRPYWAIVPQSPTVTRAELAGIVARLFGRPRPTMVASGRPKDRATVTGPWDEPVAMPPIEAQLIRYREWLG